MSLIDELGLAMRPVVPTAQDQAGEAPWAVPGSPRAVRRAGPVAFRHPKATRTRRERKAHAKVLRALKATGVIR